MLCFTEDYDPPPVSPTPVKFSVCSILDLDQTQEGKSDGQTRSRSPGRTRFITNHHNSTGHCWKSVQYLLGFHPHVLRVSARRPCAPPPSLAALLVLCSDWALRPRDRANLGSPRKQSPSPRETRLATTTTPVRLTFPRERSAWRGQSFWF